MQESTGVLRDFVARLMTLEGAEVEPIEPAGLEFISPAPLQRALGVPEFGRLGFAAELPTGAERVSFESDWLERLSQAMGQRGRVSRAVLHLPFEMARPVLSSPERMLEHTLTLQNAVYRFINVTPAWTRYLVLTFHFTALSDEKRDGITHLALNLANGSALDEFVDALLEAANNPQLERNDSVPIGAGLPPLWKVPRFGEIIHRALPVRIRGHLAPFFKSMNRRLERDLARLQDYYSDLRQESLARLRKQATEMDRERLRLDAIAREYGAKVADLQQKYAMRIDAEWVQTLELIMPVMRFNLMIKRRKGERRLHLDWNPLVRRLEPPPCEYSYTSAGGRVVCDEALHLVSPEAHGPCGACGKAYCRACYAQKCPKCGHR